MNSGDVVGEILDGKYNIEKKLGKGGMGTVYLAIHIGTGRPVAVKVIAPEFMQRAEFVERFRREARAAGRLRHPNVVDVTDFGFSTMGNGNQVAYLVMEYLDGCTLGEVLDEEKQLPLEFSVDILEQICSAVEDAHKCGIIHRDLKPDNIWLEPNQRGGYTVKVLDFGIAKLEENHIADADRLRESVLTEGSQTQVNQEHNTFVDQRTADTISDPKTSTVVSENETVALIDESKTLNSEARTMIQTDDSDDDGVAISPEDGKAIPPSNETRALESEDSKSTRAILNQPDTDKSLLGSHSTSALTRAGAVLGTPLYMSPEQCRGEKLTPRSDIYSLALIMYQMLSGKLPFTGDYVKVMDGHKSEEPPPLKAKKVPKRLRKTIMRSLSKDVESRPESAEAFASKLRSNSEGIGSLLRRALVIYSEGLPKFLLLAFVSAIPVIILTFVRVGFRFAKAFQLMEVDLVDNLTAIAAILATFAQIFWAAFLVGMTTWVVAQVLSFPLRPISVRAVFMEAKKRWKSLIVTVTASTLLAVSSWFLGFVGAVFGVSLWLGMAYIFIGKTATIFSAVGFGVVGSIVLGITVSAMFMLVAPVVMMEKGRGREAFRRSYRLVKRSFPTAIAAALLIYFIPAIIGGSIAFSVGAMLKNIEYRNQISQMKIEGVEPAKPEKKSNTPRVDFSVGSKGVNVSSTNGKQESEDEIMSRELRKSLQEGIFELLWTPLAILISSFTSVITALLYFKTRQSGGESMQGLLGELDSVDRPQSKWQERVRDRLIQSGKMTRTPKGNTSNS